MYSLVHRVHNIGSRGFDLANKIRACRLSPQFAPLRRLWVPVGVCSGRVSKTSLRALCAVTFSPCPAVAVCFSVHRRQGDCRPPDRQGHCPPVFLLSAVKQIAPSKLPLPLSQNLSVCKQAIARRCSRLRGAGDRLAGVICAGLSYLWLLWFTR